MSPPPVPSSIVAFIEEAAKGTGLPESVVAAQNYTESAYGANEGPSSAGAEGPWQFEPGTFDSIMGTITGITDWATSTTAYIKYMNSLLAEEHGSVRDALAAYNAGPGDLAAGYGYADHILAMAGQSSSITVATGGSANTSTTSALGGLVSFPSEITGFFSDADSFVTKLAWLVKPGNWLRIGAFGVAVVLIIVALYAFVRVGSDKPLLPSTIPVPVPV
jgi:hypothetical protein